ncbi:MAG: glutamate synthase large subunit [Rickettsiales bacterium]|nr:glutamate synthase large subunit [Rickettsiales bacterium]
MFEHPLYDAQEEHDACGVGMVATINGTPSREVVEKGIAALKAVYHRGALNSDGKTGDGAGIMTQIPIPFFRREIEKFGRRPEPKRLIAVGMMFLPRRDLDEQEMSRVIVESEAMQLGFEMIGWRQVPIDTGIIGTSANEMRPEIAQLIITCPPHGDMPLAAAKEAFERDLYRMRKRIEKRTEEQGIKQFYVCSLSCQTLVYKGLFKAEQLSEFYPDLNDPAFQSSFIVFHQRFSTNTAPVWHLAQPFRTIAHNGEINTVRGNTNWMRTHEASMEIECFDGVMDELRPVIPKDVSDTGALDAVMELMVRCQRMLPLAKHILMPPAWSKDPTIPAHQRAFFHYCNCIMSPWDGPAAVVGCDGTWLMAGMDRNGLRPMRYFVTKDGLLCAGSESGMVPMAQDQIRIAGRLGPGEIIALNLEAGQLYHDGAIKDWLAARHPYEEWEKNVKYLDDLPKTRKQKIKPVTADALQRRQLAAGLTREDIDLILKPMVVDGKEAIGSMGDDTPIGILSQHYRGMHHFFRQRFSQVTNPPIDSLREGRVMSLITRLGNRNNFLQKSPSQMDVLELDTPVLTNNDMDRLTQHLGKEVHVLDGVFAAKGSEGVLHQTLESLKAQMDEAFDKGKRHFVLSDEKVDASHAALPMVLLVSALHHHAIMRGTRKQITLLVRCGEMLDVHHLAVLIGMGATVVNPYMAEFSIMQQHETRHYGDMPLDDCVRHYQKALSAGMLKIMSKMGISVISSYRGGAIFEAFGLSRSLMNDYFPTLKSRISGIGLRGIELRIIKRHAAAYSEQDVLSLPAGGYYNFRRGGERHVNEGEMITLIQEATKTGRYQLYKEYSEKLNNRQPILLRDLLRIESDREPIDINEVESVASIRKRFIAPAMSLGALSPEAHEVLAIAMNKIGAWSNSGEGGEGSERYHPNDRGENRNSRIKQVASGRFGVTAEYLNHCDEIQIKIAQGAKPGEGGQLPGFKVTAEIARLRHSTPGVTLISPPPHHDIYSIEDLAQLIYDLKQINPVALISVKLVSQAGIGTIASGVAKAFADKILISGHSGGTGASPFSSIKHTGTPWEMGLSETHHLLMLNRLRHRVTLQTDGGIQTGRDVVIAAMLGAEEYGIGTLSLIALGCLLVRQCHSNTCPVGVCTQDPALRAKFEGNADKVIHLMTFIASEVREILASIGARSMDEIIGRCDLLYQVHSGSDDFDALDLSPLLSSVDNLLPDGSLYSSKGIVGRNEVGATLDHSFIENVEEALKNKQQVQLSASVFNTHRSIGARLSSLMLKHVNCDELAEDFVSLQLRGSAGQSLGVFAVQGLKIDVLGDANDYVGKGLSGGLIIVRRPPSNKLKTQRHTIIGNACLYGATSGRLFANGQAGERFAVRNSGATSVVEGAGSNACEYMTGGEVVILGNVGHNFAAGMTGGMAYVYDPEGGLADRINLDSVIYHPLPSGEWEEKLHGLITEYVHYTESAYGRAILDNWPEERKHFWQICPKEMAESYGFEEVVSHIA